VRLTFEPDTPKVESCKFRPRFDMAVIVGRENLQPFPCSRSAGEAQSFLVLAHSGVEKIEEAEGLLSVCLQHEVDQLDGIFWISRLSRLKRDRVVNRFDKMQRTQAPGD
jgi:ABC-type uncharacterized transport system auxiliary subunit